jgi:hypothetical protein
MHRLSGCRSQMGNSRRYPDRGKIIRLSVRARQYRRHGHDRAHMSLAMALVTAGRLWQIKRCNGNDADGHCPQSRWRVSAVCKSSGRNQAPRQSNRVQCERPGSLSLPLTDAPDATQAWPIRIGHGGNPGAKTPQLTEMNARSSPHQISPMRSDWVTSRSAAFQRRLGWQVGPQSTCPEVRHCSSSVAPSQISDWTA